MPRITTLKLHKSHIWSVDSNILDYRGFYVFRKSGKLLLIRNVLKLTFSDRDINRLDLFTAKVYIMLLPKVVLRSIEIKTFVGNKRGLTFVISKLVRS